MPQKWDVLIPSEIDPAGPESISDIANFDEFDITGSKEDLLPVIGDYDAIILRTVPMDREVLEAAENLKVLAKHGVGVDMIDIEAASEHDIVVCNTPGANSRAVAEFAITLLFARWKNLVVADDAVRTDNWEAIRHDKARAERRNFNQQTLGLFGCGNIGQEAARIAHNAGMTCLAFDPYIDAEALPAEIEKVETKAELFERADAVSVHTPLTPETRHAISTDELALLGADGIIVNTSRGGIIDEAALEAALENDVIEGAGLDVLSTEPPAADYPLLARDDVILSPHSAGSSKDSYEKMSLAAAANVRTVYEGDLPASTLNANELDRR